MAAFKSVNLPQKGSDLVHQIVSWTQADVEIYLTENGILGCGPVLAANSIDGKAFLQLNYESLSSWTIPIIKRSKIQALLNDLGTESYRKDVIVKAQISLRLQHATSNIHRSQNTISNSPAKQMPPSATTKSTLSLPRIAPNILPKPQGFHIKKPTPPTLPIRNFQNAGPNSGVTRPENVFVQYRVKENCISGNSVNNDEPDYLVPIAGGSELDEYDSLDNTNDRVRSLSSERSIPSLVISSDSFTDTDEECQDVPVFTATNSTPSSPKKEKVRKRSLLRNLLFASSGSKTNLTEEKGPQADPFGTPPLPPARNQNSSRCSSDSNISQSGSESQQTPPPQFLTHRQTSSQSVTSTSSLAESLPPPTKPPPPVPNASRRMIPRDSSPFFGSQTLSLPHSESSRSLCSSPVQSSPRSSNASAHSETPAYPWFFNVDRKRAEFLLRNLKDGTFLIRPSKHGGESASFTLSLQFNHRVFHVLVRQRPDGKIALGSEKNDENTFYTLNELVEFHFDEAMQLHTNHQLAGMTRLTDWPENDT